MFWRHLADEPAASKTVQSKTMVWEEFDCQQNIDGDFPDRNALAAPSRI
jgi:hypothetical protein